MIPSLAALLKRATVEDARDARNALTAERLGDHVPGNRTVRPTPVPLQMPDLLSKVAKLDRTF